jgi:hypothetical protein
MERGGSSAGARVGAEGSGRAVEDDAAWHVGPAGSGGGWASASRWERALGFGEWAERSRWAGAAGQARDCGCLGRGKAGAGGRGGGGARVLGRGDACWAGWGRGLGRGLKASPFFVFTFI